MMSIQKLKSVQALQIMLKHYIHMFKYLKDMWFTICDEQGL